MGHKVKDSSRSFFNAIAELNYVFFLKIIGKFHWDVILKSLKVPAELLP